VAFNDIDGSGDSAVNAGATNPCGFTYQAVAGYDLATGWGTPTCGLITTTAQGCLSACGGVCTNIDTDANNCGVCGHNCEGGSCVLGVCQPVVLATVIGDFSIGLATDGTNVYWTDQALDDFHGLVEEVPAGGGATVTLTSTAVVPGELAIDATNVYWDTGSDTGGDAFFTVPKAGGAVTQVLGYDNFDFPSSLAVDGQNLYWGNALTSGILKTPKATGASVTNLAPSSTNSALAVVLDSKNVYWTAGGVLLKTPIAGGTTTTLASGLDFSGYHGAAPYGLAIGGGNVTVHAPSRRIGPVGPFPTVWDQSSLAA
jgi:hypothetical protein